MTRTIYPAIIAVSVVGTVAMTLAGATGESGTLDLLALGLALLFIDAGLFAVARLHQ